MTTVQNNSTINDLMGTMNPGKATAASTADAAQDRFMTLLVTQMRNQDPLNPLDNAQVTSQLAQLSTVTGIEKLNTTVQALMGSYQASHSLQAANMIGHGVFVPGSGVDLVDSKALLGVELAEPADRVQVSILDNAGNVVHKFDLGAQKAGVLPLAWDGQLEDGTTVADGHYSFEVNAMRGAQKVQTTSLSFGAVTSVTTGPQGVKLNLPGIGEVGLSDVRQIL